MSKNKGVNVTRDGGLYIKPEHLLRDPKVQGKIKRFAKIMKDLKKNNQLG